MAHTNLYLICYDIKCKKRLRKVHQYLCAITLPIQYSVYMADTTNRQILEYQTDINKIIDPKQDDIKIYRFDKKTKISIYGKDTPLDYLLPKNFTKIRRNK